MGHISREKNFLAACGLMSVVLAMCGCKGKQSEAIHFTQGQIDSLHLEKARFLPTSTDGMVSLDLNPVLDEKSFALDELVDSIFVIPLETTEASVVNNISKLIVGDDYLYVMDDLTGCSVAIFRKDGSFVRRLPRGKGHGELIRLYDMDYDRRQRRLVAYQHSSLMFYTPDGKFLFSKQLPLGSHDFALCPDGDGYLFKSLDGQGNAHLGQLQDCTLLRTDTSLQVKEAGMVFKPHDINYGPLHNVHTNGPSVFITQTYVDTIYEYHAGALQARYVLDYSDRHFPRSLMKGSFNEFERTVRKRDCFFFTGNYLHAEANDFVGLENWHTGRMLGAYHDCATGHLVGGTSWTVDPCEMPSVEAPFSVLGAFYVSLHYCDGNEQKLRQSHLLSEPAKAILVRLTEADNPVLVCYRLKGF